jgi:glycosyltransferase involved in cell wall biosynthesis
MLTTTEMGVGGAERMVAELARIALDNGYRVALAADAGSLDRLVPAEVERIETPTRRSSPAQVARATYALARAINAFRPDVLHAHNVHSTANVAIADRLGRRRRTPLLSTFHGVPSDRYALAAQLLRTADVNVCVSRDLIVALEAARFPRGRARLVHNAVTPAEPLTDDKRRTLDAEFGLDGAQLVSIIGRLTPQKAHHRFIDAARVVAGHSPGTRFLVIGDGALRDELERQVEQAGLSDRLAFIGVREDARALISRSHLVVFSSDWEGLSIVALEAMAAGVPVVSTPAHGMSELLEGGAGRVVEDYAAESLAAAIEELLERPALRSEMGSVGQSLIASEYSVERMASAYLAIWERLAESGRATPAVG